MSRDDEDRYFIRSVVYIVVGIILLGVFIGAIETYRWTTTEYEFNKKVHSHIDNAYWASTPELMKEQLQLVIDGMHGLGLEAGDNAKYLSWEKTPDWDMAYCYQHLEAIMDRCDEVINWRNSQDNTSGQVTDVYNQKMTALHDFLPEGGWSDEIAHGAFYVKYHPFLAFWYEMIAALWIVGLVVLFSWRALRIAFW